MSKALRIGILAGESSGDILGSGLMAEILILYPDTTFEGIGGPLMIQQGLTSQVPMERLSVMGLEPLFRLRELLGIQKNLKLHFAKNPPDVFIGIDSPDFNLNLETYLKKIGIPVVHYVSPTVWAWREKRIKKIAKAVDLILTLFPFEVDIYHRHKVPASYVGHTLADIIPLDNSDIRGNSKIYIKSGSPVLALLPGSRQNEVSRLAPVFLETARKCKSHWPDLQIIIPCANEHRKKQLESIISSDFSDLDIILTEGQSRDVMAVADMILIASGTATLEALLLKKPMIVCYRMGTLAYAIISRLLKVPYFSLPNILAGKKLVDELVQDQVNAETLFKKLNDLMGDQKKLETLNMEYTKIHTSLRQNANKNAARKVLNLINK